MYKSVIRILIGVHYRSSNSQIRIYNIFKTLQVITAEAFNKLIISLFFVVVQK